MWGMPTTCAAASAFVAAERTGPGRLAIEHGVATEEDVERQRSDGLESPAVGCNTYHAACERYFT